jgi:2',3'-cyclic-nucleotide 2'-phosphodiesterase (5'-nucleotidase family)
MGRPTSFAGRALTWRALLAGAYGAIALCAVPLRHLPAQSGRVDLVIAATTDVHGRLRGWDYYANAADPARTLAGAATIVDSVRRSNPGRVVLVEGGDILQGNPLTYVAARVAPQPVHPVVAAMNVMRYDAAVIGNHEFNYGVPLLKRAMSQAAFPFLAANVKEGRKPFAPSLTYITRQGIRIAIIGATTPGSMLWDRDNLRQFDITVTDIVPAVRASVAEARRRKADIVIVLLHSGLSEAASYDTLSSGLPSENVAGRVPKEIDGIDAVVFGHSHRELVDTVINGALLMQPRNWAASVALGTLTVQKVKGKWTVVQRVGRAVRVAGHAENPDVVAASNGAHAAALKWVSSPVGRTAVAWPADSARVSDMPITDLVNEVMRRRAKADLSATAAFSLDAGLAPGSITQAALSQLYPYDNTLRAVRISGAQLRDFLEYASRYYRTLGPDGRAPQGGLIDNSVPGFNFDVVSGADYTIDLSKPLGSRITRLEYRGRAVQPTDSFTMAVNNYRQSGGGGFAMLSGARVVYQEEVDIRQAIIDEVQRVGTLDPKAYATRNWTLEPAAARAIAYGEQRRGRSAEAAGGAPTAPATNTPARAGQRTLRVIAMSDLHAALSPYRNADGTTAGGAVALSAALRAAERACAPPACESVIVDGGDLFTGQPASDWAGGRPVVDVANRLGIAAGALGNHEFDFGQDTLRMRLRELRHRVLGANVRGADGVIPPWLRADTIVDRGGIKVGIVGFAAVHTPRTASRRKVAPLTFLDPVPIYVERAAALRAAGAQVIVAVLHDGGFCDAGKPCTGSGVEVGQRLAALGATRPDVFVMAHSHVNIATDFSGMPAVEAQSSGRGVATVDVPVGGGTARAAVQAVRSEDVSGADPVVDSIVRASVQRVLPLTSQPVTTIAEPMPRSGAQSPMGNLLADAMRAQGNADIGVWNNGGIRGQFAPGPINFGALHLVTPFSNTVVRLRLRGRDVQQLVEIAVRGTAANAHVSGLRAEYDPQKPAGSRVTKLTDDKGAPIAPDRIYTVMLNDFMVEDAFEPLLKAAVASEFLAVRDIDALAQYLRRQPKPFHGDATERIRPMTPGALE